jgi:hypothetical protein
MKLQYNTTLFEAGTITRMLTHFRTLLEGIVADPASRLLDLPLLTPSEEEDVLAEAMGSTEPIDVEIALATGMWPIAEEDTPASPTRLEEEIGDICADLLSVHGIDARGDIFGDVAVAARVVEQLHSAFGVELSLHAVQAASTIARLAQIVEERLLEQATPDLVAEVLTEIERQVPFERTSRI